MDDAGFNRQRRNFIAISLFVIMYRSIGLDLKKINFLGNEASLERPSMLSAFIFVILLYYAWRFTTYTNEQSGLQKFKSSCRSRYWTKIERYIYSHAKESPLKIEGLNTSNIISKSDELFLSKAILKGASAQLSYHISGPSMALAKIPNDFQRNYSLYISPFIIICIRFRAFLEEIANSNNFTEYVFPYLIGILAILELFHFSLIIPLSKIIIPIASY